jgi:hypothetical protein
MSDIDRIEILDEDSDEYREADGWLPRCTLRTGFASAAEREAVHAIYNRVIRWDGKLCRIDALPKETIGTVVGPALKAWQVRKREQLEAMREHLIQTEWQTALMRVWAERERAKGRPEAELTFGNCVRETGVLVARDDGTFYLDPKRTTLVPPPNYLNEERDDP